MNKAVSIVIAILWWVVIAIVAFILGFVCRGYKQRRDNEAN